MSDPYVYEDTPVLKNKLGLKKQTDLDDYENTVVNLALLKLLKDHHRVTHTLDILDIHKHLFSNVYEWAGKIRTINIEKNEVVLNGLSVQYEDVSDIERAIIHIHDSFYDKPWDTCGLTSLIHELARYISSLWKIHPFREGNTRTISTYMYLFLKQHGYSLDEKLLKVHAAFFRNALVMASLGAYSDYRYLEEILADAITHKSRTSRQPQRKDKKYESVKNVKMKNYVYTRHQMKKDKS